MIKFKNPFKRECQPTEAPSTGVGGTYVGHKVYIGASSTDRALSVGAWFCASERLANTMAQLQLEYQKLNDKAHGGNYECYMRAGGKRLNYLFQVQPNPYMSASDFLRLMTLARFWYGNGCAYIERDPMSMEVVALWFCNTATYNKFSDKYTIQYGPLGIFKEVDSVDIIHWRNTFTTDDGLVGVGTLTYAANSLSLAATNDAQALDNSSKGGKFRLLLTEQQAKPNTFAKPTKQQQEGVRDKLQRSLDEGADVLLYSGLMDAKVISQDATQMQLLESRKFDTPVISRFSGVPPVLLMDYTNNTYKAPEQAMQDFLLRTIGPMAQGLSQEFTRKIVGDAGWPTFRLEFNDESLMRLDPLGRANIAKSLLESGIMCPNELRKDYNLPAIEGGDRHFISTNLQPLDNPTVGQQQNGKEVNNGNA